MAAEEEVWAGDGWGGFEGFVEFGGVDDVEFIGGLGDDDVAVATCEVDVACGGDW